MYNRVLLFHDIKTESISVSQWPKSIGFALRICSGALSVRTTGNDVHLTGAGLQFAVSSDSVDHLRSLSLPSFSAISSFLCLVRWHQTHSCRLSDLLVIHIPQLLSFCLLCDIFAFIPCGYTLRMDGTKVFWLDWCRCRRFH